MKVVDLMDKSRDARVPRADGTDRQGSSGPIARRAVAARPYLPIAVLLLFPIVLFAPVIFLQTHSFFVFSDNVDQFYAWYQKLAQSVHRGYLPLWDANSFSGRSFAGELQTGVFYPLNLLWVTIFGSTAGISLWYLELLVVVHFFLASVGMYLLCRQWHLTSSASLGAGLVFAYTGSVAYRAEGQTCIFFGMALLPFGLYFVARYLATAHVRHLYLSGFVLALQILAGHFEPFFHTALLVTGYLCVASFCQGFGFFGRLSLFVGRLLPVSAAALIISLPQLLLSFQYLGNAYRWVQAASPIGPGQKVPFSVYASKNIIEPHQFLNLLSASKVSIDDGNNLYIGLLPLALVALLASAPMRRRITEFQPHLVLLLAVSLFAILAALGHYTFVSRILYALPFVTEVRELGRYILLLHFALAAFVGFAIQSIRVGGLRLLGMTRPVVAATVLAPSVVVGLLTAGQRLAPLDASQAAVVLAFFALAVLIPRRALGLAVAAVVLTAVSVLLNQSTFEATVQASTAPSTYFGDNAIINYLERFYGKERVLIDGNALPPNIGDVYPIQTKLGHDATMYKPFFDFISRDWSDGSKVNDLLNVRFIVSTRTLPLRLVMEDEHRSLKLYERNTYYPRVFFRDELTLTGREIEARRQFTVLHYDDVRQTYLIRTTRREQVIFSEIWYPDWRAYVDGKRVAISRPSIDGLPPLLRAIYLGPGEHRVSFSYLNGV